ncbi:hypothetical protein ABZV93_02465 [Actinopolymorpha sp. NPDC004070]|uniref:hypothetical protein n=1 Tax=Actinopolymorpha sp. NPDC004070 TaxID=3154548 RepID=UPI0033BB0564
MSLSSPTPVTLGEGVRTDGPSEGLRVRGHTLHHEGTGVTEAWVEVTNGGDRDVVVDRLDSLTLDLPGPPDGPDALDGGDRRTGADLQASGWTVSLPEEGSAVVVLRRVRSEGGDGR